MRAEKEVAHTESPHLWQGVRGKSPYWLGGVVEEGEKNGFTEVSVPVAPRR